MKERFQTLADHIRSVENESRQVRADLKAAVLGLPDNPSIQRVGQAPKCYTISSKELFARDNWTARFHDFKTQYQELCDFIDTIPVDGDVVARMEKVLREGYIQHPKERTKFHPDVRANVAKLLDIDLTKEAAR